MHAQNCFKQLQIAAFSSCRQVDGIKKHGIRKHDNGIKKHVCMCLIW